MTGSRNCISRLKRMKVKPIPEKTALPPGSMIGEMLAMQQISLSSFASALEMTETDAESLLAGGLPLTDTIAKKLETLLDLPAHFWLGLEASYRSDLRK